VPHAHAHAHAHSHAGGACEASHGLFDAHHHDWSHLAMQPRSRRMLKLALAVQAVFLLLEVVGGVLTNSLALLGDAAHMLADVGALGLALLAANLAARAVDARRTWGMPRAEMLAAAFNSFTLVVSCAWIAYEAVRRLMEPEAIAGRGLIAIAFAGLLANLLGAWLLANADRDNVNIRAAMLHLLLDAASSVGVIIAGIVIVLGGPVYIDTIASLLIVFLAVKGTWPVLRSSLDSLVDAAPPGVDANDVIRAIASAPGVRQVHDVHVWEPGPRRMAATAHVLVDPDVDVGAAILELRGLLRERLGIDHATLQVAPDRRIQLHDIDPVLPRDAAIERAVSIVAAARPTIDRAAIRRAVELRAPVAEPGATAAPVRLVAGAIHDL
jgi:cobalt-zinc-cadmium efflux system protein